MFQTQHRIVALCAVATLTLFTSFATAQQLKLEKGDHVCLIGNELGERMQHQNVWETLLHQRFPEHQLAVRNLCFPGDEVDLRIRIKNFGSPEKHLTHSEADVVLMFFGFNESFDGPDGLDDFKSNLATMIDETKEQKFNGESAPRLALISPIAFENVGDKHLPTGEKQNENIALYTQAMAEVAKEKEIGFVDLFTPTKKLFERRKCP